MEIKDAPIKIRSKKAIKNKVILMDSYNTGLNHLFLRHSKYTDIPHFSILKNGEVYRHLQLQESPFGGDGIYVCFENLGVLDENSMSLFAIYSNSVCEREWRNERFFDCYSDEQLISFARLARELPVKLNMVDSNVLEKGMGSFEGICCRANFDKKYLDVNPSFDFEKLKGYIWS